MFRARTLAAYSIGKEQLPGKLCLPLFSWFSHLVFTTNDHCHCASYLYTIYSRCITCCSLHRPLLLQEVWRFLQQALFFSESGCVDPPQTALLVLGCYGKNKHTSRFYQLIFNLVARKVENLSKVYTIGIVNSNN